MKRMNSNWAYLDNMSGLGNAEVSKPYLRRVIFVSFSLISILKMFDRILATAI